MKLNGASRLAERQTAATFCRVLLSWKSAPIATGSSVQRRGLPDLTKFLYLGMNLSP
jgi:hypothetical protein